MEGVSHEAGSLAGHLKLGKLDLPLRRQPRLARRPHLVAFTEDVRQALRGLRLARAARRGRQRRLDGDRRGDRRRPKQDPRPSLIACGRRIGYGSPHKAGTPTAHGAPLGEDEIVADEEEPRLATASTRSSCPTTCAHFCRGASSAARSVHESGRTTFDAWARRTPAQAPSVWSTAATEQLPAGGSRRERSPSVKTDEAVATRSSERQGDQCDRGAARAGARRRRRPISRVDEDRRSRTAATSTAETAPGRNIHFGVREHAMGGDRRTAWPAHGGVRPSARRSSASATTCGPPIRLAALSQLPSIFVFTHDSIGLGEDGPTHQPVEQLTSLRAMPNMERDRGRATPTRRGGAWRGRDASAKDGPTASSSRARTFPLLDRSGDARGGLSRGAYCSRIRRRRAGGRSSSPRAASCSSRSRRRRS